MLKNLLPTIENISFKENSLIVKIAFFESSESKNIWFKNLDLLKTITFRTVIVLNNKEIEEYKFDNSKLTDLKKSYLVYDFDGLEITNLSITDKNKQYYCYKEITFDKIKSVNELTVFSGYFVRDSDYKSVISFYTFKDLIREKQIVSKNIIDLKPFEEISKIEFPIKNTVQDNNKNISINLDNLEIKETKVFELKQEIKEPKISCFSSLMFNWSEESNFQIAFFIDIIQILKTYSPYFGLFNNQQFVDFFKSNLDNVIKKIRIFRSKCDNTKHEINNLSTNLNKISIEELSKELVEDIDLNTYKNNLSYDKKFFIVSDNNLLNFSHGNYSYSIELTLLDTIEKLFESIILNLKENLYILNLLENLIYNKQLYNFDGGYFKKEFFNEVNKIKPNLIKKLFSDLSQTVNKLSDSNIDLALFSLLSDESNFTLDIFEKLKMSYREIIQKLEISFQNIQTNSEQKVKIDGTDKSIKILYTFPDNIQTPFLKNRYIQFLPEVDKNILTLSRNSVKNLIRLELNKFYSVDKIKNYGLNYFTAYKIKFENNIIENFNNIINKSNFEEFNRVSVLILNSIFGKIVDNFSDLNNLLQVLSINSITSEDNYRDNLEDKTQIFNFILEILASEILIEENLLNLNIFNKQNPSNIIKDIKNVNLLPVQIKFLLDSFEQLNEVREIYKEEPFNDIEKLFGLIFNFKIISKFEYLEGFKENSTNFIWKDITDEILNSKETYLCRVQYFIDNKLGIPENIIHNLDILGNYFILN